MACQPETAAVTGHAKITACLQRRPGERLRFEVIAAETGLTSQQASAALSVMLRDGTLPGLTRPGRGTYQYDPQPQDMTLPCPRCETEIDVSGEDPDASLSILWNHLGTHTRDHASREQLFVTAQRNAKALP